MHPNPRKVAPILLAVLVMAALTYWSFSSRAAKATDGALTASGTIEITQVQIGPELGGRVIEVMVAEGDRVTAGEVLAQFDTALLQEQRKQAEAALAGITFQESAAKANLTLLQAGPSAEQLAVSEATVNQAQVAYAAARAVYADLPEAIQDSVDGKAALAKADAAEAALQTAQAQYELVKAGSRPEQIEAAGAQLQALGAQVQAAQAALRVLDVQISKLTLTAPADGVVMTVVSQPGEFAAPGSTLLILGQDEMKTITVYIPEEAYGQISLGQTASLSVDSFPGEVFEATVVHISDKAEFTPRNVQTVEGRKDTVFAIKLKLVDPQNKLKAGMPADVVFK